MPSDFRWHSFLVSAGYLPDTGSFAVFISKRENDRFLKHFIAATLTERCVCHVCDLFFVHPTAFCAALTVEVGFNLVDGRNDFIVGDQVE